MADCARYIAQCACGEGGLGSLTLSQPVWACTAGLTRSGRSRPLAAGDVASVLAETGEVQREGGGLVNPA